MMYGTALLLAAVFGARADNLDADALVERLLKLVPVEENG